MPTPPSHPIHVRNARCAFWWRIGFAAYVVTLLTATHWPNMDLGSETAPATDKIIHLYAFGLLMALLWQTRWVRSIPLLLVIGMVWVGADEYTQSMVEGRDWSWLDMSAGAMGVLVVCAWLWALKPVGELANLRRLQFAQRVIDDLFSTVCTRNSFLAWLLLGLGVVPVGLGLIFVWPHVVVRLPKPTPALAYGVVEATYLGVLLYFGQWIWMRAMNQALAEKRCRACGASCVNVAFDRHGEGRCQSCNTSVHHGEWQPRVGPPWDRLKRLLVRPLLFGLLVLGAGVAALYAFVALYTAIVKTGGSLEWMRSLVNEVDHMPIDFQLTVDLALLLMALAVSVRLYRGALARFQDLQHDICRQCEHDLRGTPVNQGVGRCGECGTPFARFPGAPD